MKCRHCRAPVEHTFVDLGFAPPSNSYLDEEALRKPEVYYPLKLKICAGCWLVQTEDYAEAHDLFSPDYAYFSSTSSSWLAHARAYCAAVTRRLDLGPRSLVIEIASNDGYLLRNFLAARIPCLGIEPTASTAAAAEKLGVPVVREFFGEALAVQLAAQGRQADLIVGNNVYAHVPDINDFSRGLKLALKPGGTITLEFPHLMRLLEHTQFDTVYHEHFSYLSLLTASGILSRAGLRLLDVEELPTHGGSLRVYAGHDDDSRATTAAVQALLDTEGSRGLCSLATYQSFQSRANAVKDALLAFLLEQKAQGRSVAGYGAAAKGNTLLNYAGIKSDLLAYVCDAAPAKQAKYLPGSHIPVLHPDALAANKPDIVLILPWNIADEVRQQHSYISQWGGRFAIAVPSLQILD